MNSNGHHVSRGLLMVRCRSHFWPAGGAVILMSLLLFHASSLIFIHYPLNLRSGSFNINKHVLIFYAYKTCVIERLCTIYQEKCLNLKAQPHHPPHTCIPPSIYTCHITEILCEIFPADFIYVYYCYAIDCF